MEVENLFGQQSWLMVSGIDSQCGGDRRSPLLVFGIAQGH